MFYQVAIVVIGIVIKACLLTILLLEFIVIL